MLTTLSPHQNQVILHNVRWSTYQALVKDSGLQTNKRLTYDHGILEIMTPLPEHEIYKKLIDRLILVTVEEMDMEIRSLGSCTWSRKDLKQGLEPDECYYINHEKEVRGKKEINLNIDPPPDLAIEIDITSSSLNRMSIYAQLGITEVWRYDGQILRINCLVRGEYQERERSEILPILSAREIRLFLQQSEEGEIALIKAFRLWLKEKLARPC